MKLVMGEAISLLIQDSPSYTTNICYSKKLCWTYTSQATGSQQYSAYFQRHL